MKISLSLQITHLALAAIFMVQALPCLAASSQEPLEMESFVSHALDANKALAASRQRWLAKGSTVSSSASLPDPMLMLGYKNEGFERITYGEMDGSEWMASVSQTLPFWGKRSLRRSSTRAESDALGYSYHAQRQDLERRARELYLDMFLTYKSGEILGSRTALLDNIERAALNRYANGMSSQSDVIMVQSEKYMIIERLEMLLQKRRGLEAEALAMLDMEPSSQFGQPAQPPKSPMPDSEEHYLALAGSSPMVQEKRRMLSSGQSMVSLAHRDYYPDFTFTAQVNQRPEPFTDMWQVNVSFNLPVYYLSKQRAELSAAKMRKSAFESDLDDTIRSLQAEVRENLSMALASERLMQLYEGGFISKTKQSFDSSLTAYSNGKVEVMALMRSLSVLTDYEISYWERFVLREKAIARLKAITAGAENISSENNHDE